MRKPEKYGSRRHKRINAAVVNVECRILYFKPQKIIEKNCHNELRTIMNIVAIRAKGRLILMLQDLIF